MREREREYFLNMVLENPSAMAEILWVYNFLI